MHQPWEFETGIWKNKTAYFQWLRGALRRIWNKSPLKINFLKEHRKRIPNPNPKGKTTTIWGGDCEICGKTFRQNMLQVDHIVPAGKLSDWNDVTPFIQRLLATDNLRLLCKNCHNIVTYAERHSLSFEEATIEKDVVEFKGKKAAQQIQFLKEKGLSGKNATERIEAYRKWRKRV